MFKNHITVAIRNLRKSRIFSFITIVGLSLGLWACMTMTTVVMDELSYDTQWSKGEQLYRLISYGGGQGEKVARGFTGLVHELPQNFPEIKKVVALNKHGMDLRFQEGDNTTVHLDALEADTGIWQLLDFDVLAGRPQKLVHGQNNIVITQQVKELYFPNSDPIGKTIYTAPGFDDPQPYMITGVIQNFPKNTHLRADVMVLKEPSTAPLPKEGFGTLTSLYLLLQKGVDLKSLQDKVDHWYADYMETENPMQYEFQPISQVFLHSDFEQGQKDRGSMDLIYILGGVALMLLLIALVNFVNLSTARTAHRLKEIGTRKVLGAKRNHIATQFLVESLVFFLLSTVVATLGYFLTLPYVVKFLGHPLEMTFVSRPLLFLGLICSILLVSFLVGWYPARLLSRLRPLKALQGKTFQGNSVGKLLQRGLVMFQFSISMVVLIGLMVVGQQLRFLNHADIGYQKENLLAISKVAWDNKGDAFKQEVLGLSDVRSVALSKWLPTFGQGSRIQAVEDPQNPGNPLTINYIEGDVDLPKTLGLELEEGRLFSNQHPTDITVDPKIISFEQMENAPPAVSLFSAYAQKRLQVKDLNVPNVYTNTLPVGIVGNVTTESLRKALSPTIIQAKSNIDYGGMLIKVAPGQEVTVMNEVHRLWKDFYPDKVLEIQPVSQLLAAQYEKEAKLQQLLFFFGALILFLCALGVFGLIEQATAQRIKEIGVRKVLGATDGSIVYLFFKFFVGLLAVAAVLGFPLAWYGAQAWLQSYAHKISLGESVFALAMGVTALITFLTVGWQCYRTVRANPVQNLRTE